jgi:hypothetical protein
MNLNSRKPLFVLPLNFLTFPDELTKLREENAKLKAKLQKLQEVLTE